jgi:hypothetical protein
MLYMEIIAVCSEIHTKHINAVCGQNVELVNVKPRGARTYVTNDDSFLPVHDPAWLGNRFHKSFERSGNDYPVTWCYVPEKKGVLNHNSVQTTTLNGTLWVLGFSLITYFLGLLNTEEKYEASCCKNMN